MEAVLTPDPSGERVSDELDAMASAHYDTKALWTLTMEIDQTCFFIPVALIAKPIPGKEQQSMGRPGSALPDSLAASTAPASRMLLVAV